jgi:exopolyphosphatase/guanosine-5'-triphosphate,3'-diphosphate pyrophosphatase
MRASIDVGSNSLLLLVQDDAGMTLADEQQIIGLGKGLGPERGLFRPDRMEAGMAVFRDYADRAKALGVQPPQIRAVATSAARRALNAATFFADVQRKTGIKVEVISGEEEARYTWLGCLEGIDLPAGTCMVVDPGGGSTEAIFGEGRQMRSRLSMEVGTVRLTEQFLGYGAVSATAYAKLRAHVDEVVGALVVESIPRVVVAVAGTATTLMALELGLTSYEPAKIHGGTLSAGALRKWIDRLLAASPEERQKLVAVSPGRADTLLAGATILVRVLEQARRQACRVSNRGLRHGVLVGR